MIDGIEDLLYPICDAMQMKLTYMPKAKRVHGGAARKLELADGVKIAVNAEAVSSFINVKEEQAGVLFHLKGYLYFLVAWNNKGQQLSAYVISSQSLGKKRLELVDSLPKLCNIKTAVTQLSKGVKQAYSRSLKSTKWEAIELPDSMRA